MNLEQWLFTTGVNATTVRISIVNPLNEYDPIDVTIVKNDRDAFIVPTTDTTDKTLLMQLIKETVDPQIQDLKDRIPNSDDILDLIRQSGEFCDEDAVRECVEQILNDATVTIDV